MPSMLKVEKLDQHVQVRFIAGNTVLWKHGRVIYTDPEGLIHVRTDDGTITVKWPTDVRIITEEEG